MSIDAQTPRHHLAGWTTIAALLAALAGPAGAVSDLSDQIYQTTIHPDELNAIKDLLPESQVNDAFVADGVDPNIRLLEDTELSVTFIDEGAGYRNSFGYFLFDDDNNILEERTIFANASLTGAGGSLNPGDTVDLGTFSAGTNIGFWLQANGYTDSYGHTYYTLDQYNPDGLRHVAVMADVLNERIVLGIEDLYNLGDQDYNDAVFTFSASTFSAIDIASMPSGAPEAGPLATALISASLFGVYAGRRRARQATHRRGSTVA